MRTMPHHNLAAAGSSLLPILRSILADRLTQDRPLTYDTFSIPRQCEPFKALYDIFALAFFQVFTTREMGGSYGKNRFVSFRCFVFPGTWQ